MSKHRITDKRRKWLVSQLDDWELRRILSADASSRILDLYETKDDLAERKQSAAVVTLMAVAAVLVGMGALLLIGYNWAAMPDALKLLVIFAVIIGTQIAAYRLRFKRGAELLSEVVFFLGCLFYGAGIMLVAQIFNLNAHYPDGVWWWALGVLPFALCLKTPLLHALLVFLLAIWCGMEMIGFGDTGFWFFGRWGYVHNGAYSLPVLALPGLLLAYHKKSIATVALYVPLFAWWLVLQPVALDLGWESVFFVGAVGGLLLIIAEIHREGSRFAIPYRIFGFFMGAGVLLVLSFYDFNEGVLRAKFEARALTPILVIAVISGGLLLLNRFFTGDELSGSSSDTREATSIAVRQAIPVGLVLLMVFLVVWSFFIGTPLLPTVVANIAMIFLALWLIGVGLREDRGLTFAAGVSYFLLWAIVRYIDLFGDFGGMLGGALMFFLCGGALFGVAVYWRKRRQLQQNG